MNIKLIIFDMDGTLYDLNDVIESNYEMQVNFLIDYYRKQRGEIVKYLESNHIYPTIRKDSKSATELFAQVGIPVEKWSKYREENFEVEKIKLEKTVSNDVIRLFAEKYSLVLLSSNSRLVINRVLSKLHIEQNLFNDIICSDNYPYEGKFNKKRAMEYLLEKYELPAINVLSVGDRYKTDIEPMIQIGGCGIQVRTPLAIKGIIDYLYNEKECIFTPEDFEMFTPEN